MSITVTDDSLLRAIANLAKRMPKELDLVAETLAAKGKEYARDIITVTIYSTPERSGYKRTRYLIRSIYSAVERGEGRHSYSIIVGAAANYSAYNELGTYDGYLGEDEAEAKILADARADQRELITLEYGDVERGLEPRPYILPSIVMLERELPDLLSEAMNRAFRP